MGEAHAATSQIATRAERFIEWRDAEHRGSVTASRADRGRVGKKSP
jgi:hypothetical protein